MVDYLGAQPEKAYEKCSSTNGTHVKFSFLKIIYDEHLDAEADSESEGNEFFVQYHHECALRCYFMFLVGTYIFVDKIETYMDVAYLQYFMNLETVREWKWGAGCLERIISRFPRIHGIDLDLQYSDDMQRVAMMYLERTVHDDINWMSFEDHREIIPFDLLSLYSGWLAYGTNIMVRYLPERCIRKFSYVQTIPRYPFQDAPNSTVRRDLDGFFQDLEHQMVPEEYQMM
ncbi:uncharacterized protein LOC131639322 [Vicia villosa]|uniref:uncharacterized protein LOC131639322 n=1 Tax=Vicia villosa TaxID=3911 RepID=UPI00273B81E6|nr:uncharacterized protein LOC131639322 [Vicia villosa]